MSEQERQLVIKTAKCVLAKSMNSNDNLVDYKTVEQETKIPINVIKSIARQICKCLMLSQNVEDVDCVDNEAFDVMIKKRSTVRG